MNSPLPFRPLVFAHRGARIVAPENTLAAFERAACLHADGVEFDVLLTQDRIPVVTHNDNLALLTAHSGHVRDIDFATLQHVDVGSHFGPAWAGCTMPTLPETLDLLKKLDLIPMVEIKFQRGLADVAAELIGGIVSDYEFRRPALICSFSPKIIRRVHQHFPHLSCGLIMGSWCWPHYRSAWYWQRLGLSTVNPRADMLTRSLVDRAHHAEHMVHTWTVNTPAQIDDCLRCGVDGIITDDVEATNTYLDQLITKGALRRHI